MNLFYYVEELPWAYGVVIVSLALTSFAFLGICIVRHFVHPSKLKEHHDFAGFVFTNIGVLYAVLLGFTVVNAQQRFDKIAEILELEASYLDQLYQDAEIFSDKDKENIRFSIKNYTQIVVKEEWNLISQGEASDLSSKALKKIWKTYADVSVSGFKQQAWYSESINKLNLLRKTQLQRLLESNSSLGVEMWSLLIFGGVILVAFTWFFGVVSLKSHLLMSAILASTTGFLLFLIYSLDSAFSGSVSVSPEAYNKVIQSFQQDKK